MKLCSADANAKALRRQELVEKFDAGLAAGMTAPEAAAGAGGPLPTLRRWSRRYAAEGFDGLLDKCHRSGRRRTIALNEEERALARALYAKSKSAATALRQLAHDDACRDEVRDFILKPRRSKHNMPKWLRRSVMVAPAVIAYDQGPRAFAETFFSPRDLTYIASDGSRRRLAPGDVFERDDMTVNFGWWVPWPWGGCACSDKFGVRLLRGQLLAQIDVASLRFLSFELVARLRDSYRADDIWSWIGRAYRDIGLPRIGERLERGIWEGHTINGVPLEPGHTPLATRLGGLAALGVRVIRSYRPTTKIIENRFNFYQTWMATIPGQLGRKRGEMERETKLWTACRNGHRDPREFFLSMEAAAARIEAATHAVNSEPVEGRIYRGVPDEVWRDGVGGEGRALRPLPAERTWLFARQRSIETVRKAHVRVRLTGPDGPASFWFHAPEFIELEGKKVGVYFDPVWPEQRAVITDAAGQPNEILCYAALVESVPQFSCADGYMEESSLQRRRNYVNAVRSEYRALGLFGRRYVKGAALDDGRGNITRIETDGTRSPAPISPGTRNAFPPRTTPTTFDRDAAEKLIAQREAEARERGELMET